MEVGGEEGHPPYDIKRLTGMTFHQAVRVTQQTRVGGDRRGFHRQPKPLNG